MDGKKRPLSIRVPETIYQAIEQQALDTGLSITDVAVSMLGAATGQAVPTPGDRLTALEREVNDLRGKLRSLAIL